MVVAAAAPSAARRRRRCARRWPSGLRKSNGVPATGAQLAGRDQRRVDRREAVRVDQQLVAEDVARALAGEVEVGVVGEVDDRGLVGRRRVVDARPLVGPVSV